MQELFHYAYTGTWGDTDFTYPSMKRIQRGFQLCPHASRSHPRLDAGVRLSLRERGLNQPVFAADAIDIGDKQQLIRFKGSGTSDR